MRLSVVLGEWLDRPIEADLDVAVAADRLGYHQVWIGEMAKLDAPAAAAHVVARTEQIEPCLGPPAVTVRSPVQIALAGATVASTGRRTHVALGTSSDVDAREGRVACWSGWTTDTGEPLTTDANEPLIADRISRAVDR
jgi:alkanesulfonate monooxygenase SsuD/methylene tetrahydromethanopterin reductase-like flavin-dependent oxidoreductase (luciferase family)